jgi:hypothetical protein
MSDVPPGALVVKIGLADPEVPLVVRTVLHSFG